MYLAPHHFQAQNRYFEDSANFAISSLWRTPYGFTAYQVNEDAIRNGTVTLVSARGIFRDGLAFDMPECDPLPKPLAIAPLFPPTADSVTVSLAIPRQVPDGLNCTLENGFPAAASTRFIGSLASLPDENTGRDEKPIYLGRKNIRLVANTESSDELLTLPFVRVVRAGSGTFAYDSSFVPPCIRLTASEHLVTLLRRLVEILEDKSSVLTQSHVRSQGKFKAGLSSGQVAQFWLLHSINSSLAPLRHLLLTKHGHPEELYCEMLRLGGALCTFGLDSHPKTLPVYDHDHLEQRFDALDDHIRRHLEIVLPSQAISIPLTEHDRFFHNGPVKDDRCFGRSRWILGIRAAVGEADLITLTPRLAKFCSAKFVPELVKRALPGLTLTHLPVPPQAISARVDCQYFAINRSGPCWEHIVQSKQVGVYVPGELPRPELELTVLLES
jgi:type VI secretion system protein ImpJ